MTTFSYVVQLASANELSADFSRNQRLLAANQSLDFQSRVIAYI